MRWKPKVLLISLLMIILPILAVISFSSISEAVGEPDIVIVINQPKQTAYVAPGQDGIVTFTGTVEVDIPWDPSFQYLIVELEADAGGWPASSPPALIFSRQTTVRSYSLSVQVPIGTSSKTKGELVISGKWSYSPGILSGECDPATAIIVVDWYSQFDISSNEPIVEAERDDRVEISILVENEGNGNDRVRLEIENIDELEDEGLTPIMADYSVTIVEGETVEAKLYIETDRRTDLDIFGIDVIGVSEICEDLGMIRSSDRFTVYVDVVNQKKETEPEPKPEPEPEPEPEIPKEPEPEPEPEPEVEEDDGVDGSGGDVETTVSGDAGTSPNASLIVIIAILVTILVIGSCVGLYFFIRSSGTRKSARSR